MLEAGDRRTGGIRKQSFSDIEFHELLHRSRPAHLEFGRHVSCQALLCQTVATQQPPMEENCAMLKKEIPNRVGASKKVKHLNAGGKGEARDSAGGSVDYRGIEASGAVVWATGSYLCESVSGQTGNNSIMSETED